jgi:thiosulfate/3-mercaptopyruvate sulfurtransferase
MILRAGVLALLLAGPATAAVAASDLPPLLAPAELVEVMAELSPLILDIRAPGAADRPGTHAAGHIAGAVSAPYALFRGPEQNPGQLPSEAELTALLRSLGVAPDRPTVIVHQGADETDFGASARVYWTLKSSGVRSLAILNGGVAAWVAAGLPLDMAQVSPVPSTIEVAFSDRWLATEADVLAVVEGRAEATLIDARPEAFWQGREFHRAAARPGTLPQSRLFPHSRWFDGGPAIVDAAAARALAQSAGYGGDEALISFCNTGHWAATNWFALSELAGIEDVRLYPDSMVGWSNAGHAMDNVPGPLRRVWQQIADAF